MNNLTENQDFFVFGDHARLSGRKVAELLMIHHSSVQKWIGGLTNTTLAENIVSYGFDGDALNLITGYYATSSRVKEQVRANAVSLLIKSSSLGFQAFIDKLAGIKSQPTKQLSLAEIVLNQAQAVVDIEKRLAALEQAKIKAEEDMSALPLSDEAALEIPTRGKINVIVRNKCQRDHLSYRATWTNLYYQLYYRYHYDVKARCRNSGLKPLDQIEKDNMLDKLHAIASEVLI